MTCITKKTNHLITNVTESESWRHEKMLPKIDRIGGRGHALRKREGVLWLPAKFQKRISPGYASVIERLARKPGARFWTNWSPPAVITASMPSLCCGASGAIATRRFPSVVHAEASIWPKINAPSCGSLSCLIKSVPGAYGSPWMSSSTICAGISTWIGRASSASARSAPRRWIASPGRNVARWPAIEEERNRARCSRARYRSARLPIGAISARVRGN